MKKIFILLLLVAACTKEVPVPYPVPTPIPVPAPQPVPVPVPKKFKIVGKTVTIEGVLKPSAKFSPEDAVKHFQGVVDSIDAK